jgi:hypothetical protein
MRDFSNIATGGIQGVEAQLADRVKTMQESCKKDSNAAASYIENGLGKLSAALQKVVDAMKQTETEFKARMAEHWARYQQTADKLGTFEQVRILKGRHFRIPLQSREMCQVSTGHVPSAK